MIAAGMICSLAGGLTIGGIMRIIAFAIGTVVLATYAAPAEARTRDECKQDVQAKYPSGTLSKSSGDRERLIQQCMKGGGVGTAVKIDSRTAFERCIARNQAAGHTNMAKMRAVCAQ